MQTAIHKVSFFNVNQTEAEATVNAIHDRGLSMSFLRIAFGPHSYEATRVEGCDRCYAIAANHPRHPNNRLARHAFMLAVHMNNVNNVLLPAVNFSRGSQCSAARRASASSTSIDSEQFGLRRGD